MNTMAIKSHELQQRLVRKYNKKLRRQYGRFHKTRLNSEPRDTDLGKNNYTNKRVYANLFDQFLEY